MSLCVSQLLGLCYNLESLLNLLSSKVACFYSFCWPSVLQCFSFSQLYDRFYSPLTPPNPCPLSLQGPILPPHQLGLRCLHLCTLACLTFLSSVDGILGIMYFLLNTYILVSTFHVCPFLSELLHSGYVDCLSIEQFS